MTACLRLMKALQPENKDHNPETRCVPCVYFSNNLDPKECPGSRGGDAACGLGFRPADPGCAEMRTDNCSARKK